MAYISIIKHSKSIIDDANTLAFIMTDIVANGENGVRSIPLQELKDVVEIDDINVMTDEFSNLAIELFDDRGNGHRIASPIALKIEGDNTIISLSDIMEMLVEEDFIDFFTGNPRPENTHN